MTTYRYRYLHTSTGTSPVTKYRHPTQSDFNEDPSQVTSLLVVILLSHARDSKCRVVADQPTGTVYEFLRTVTQCGLGELVPPSVAPCVQ